MKSVNIPLQIVRHELLKAEDHRQAIDQSLGMLLTTPCYSSVADPQYGFIFNNLRFEIFNEHEGVVYNSSESADIFEGKAGLYDKKISGTSKNLNTFAAELKHTIATYERRLSNVSVSMTYIREERKIYITIKGVITDLQTEYQYSTTINVWK